MGVIGVSAGPDQIADGTNPNQLAAVDSSGNISELNKGLDPGGVVRTMQVGAGGKTALLQDDVLFAILVELRTMNSLLAAIGAGQTTIGDPEQYRQDADVTNLVQALS